MPTDVYFPLPAPSDPGHLSEHHPYGPLPGGTFNTDLGIEIQRPALKKYPLLAVVDGTVRLIPGPLLPVLVLGNVRGQAMQDLQSVVGESLVVFLYRNVDIASVAGADAVKDAMIRWQSSQQNKGGKTLAEIRKHFLNGKFQVEVKAGDALGVVASAGAGNPHLGFEVVYTPSGLVGESGWLRLTEILDPANKATRRMDPTSFYHRVASGPTSTIRVKLPGSQVSHGLLPRLTKRILLELRDEYDLPFQGIVTVADSVSATDYVLTAPDRGTVALPSPTPGDRTVSITNHVLTELPSGSSSSRTPTKPLSAPTHWSLQSIFMDHVFSQESWFAHNESQLPLFTEGNRVTPLVDGTAAFKEMVQAMQNIRGSTDKHFLRLAGWWLSDDFEMIPGQAGSTFAKLTEDIAKSGGDVHAMVWRPFKDITLPPPYPPIKHNNSAAVDRINKLKQGSRRKGFAIYDPANVPIGSHHQKFMIASAGSGVAVGFCGGVDINPNRLDTPFHTIEDPYHDLHAKIEGPAVADLNATFVQRWNFNSEVSPGGSLPRIDPSVAPATNRVGSQFVQVTRTYPWYCSYLFAPLGETGTLLTLRRAIQRARRFIYFEDQYVTPYAQGRADGSGDTLGILSDLLAALHRIEYLIIVLPNYAGQPNGRQFRYRFIRVLEAEAKKPGVKAKVLVFYLRRAKGAPKVKGARLEDVAIEFALMTQGMAPGIMPKLEHSGDSNHPEEIFTHSKVWLIDDVYAKIGSANVNRRSLTHDSELDIHIIDGAITRGARRFARELRLQLWGEMLNARPDYLNIQLEDPSYALQFWETPPPGSFVVPYNAAAEGGNGKLLPDETQGQILWDGSVDPDGHVGGVCRRRRRREVRLSGEGGLSEGLGAEFDLEPEVSSDFGEQVLAHLGETDEMYDGGFGKTLVRSTDQAIASGKLHSSRALLRHMLSEAHLPKSGISTEVWDELPFCAADLFDAFTSNKLPRLREYFTQFFDVVALPGSRIDNDLHPGDCLVRRALGEGNLAHVALLVTGEVFRAEELASRGLRPESWRPGLYAEVIEAGPFPHCLEDMFARCLGDENGQLSHDSLILRIRDTAQNSFRPFFPTLGGAVETSGGSVPSLPPAPYNTMPLGLDFHDALSFKDPRSGQWHIVAHTLSDFQRLVRLGKSFVILKASQNGPDAVFATHYALAHQAGLLRGAYHWFTPNSVADQVNLFVGLVRRLGPGDLPPSLDVEDGRLTLFRHYHYIHHFNDGHQEGNQAGTNRLLDDLQEWLDRVEAALGRTPIIYTGTMWRDDLQSTRMSNYPLWTIPRHFSTRHWPRAEILQYAEEGGNWLGFAHYTELHVNIAGTQYDAYNGTIYGLRGLADIGRPGVALSVVPPGVGLNSVPYIAHAEIDNSLHLMIGPAWADRNLSAGDLPGRGADPVLLASRDALFLYFRSGNDVIEATASGANNWRWNSDKLDALPVPIHDPRAVLSGNQRFVVYWGDDDDWHLLTWNRGWASSGGLLSRANLRTATGGRSTGQPTVYVSRGVMHVVGRVDRDGHLFDLWLDGAVWRNDDITALARRLVPNMPAATYSPCAYETSAGVAIAFCTVRGDIWVIRRSDNTPTNITAAAHAKPAAGHPTCFVFNDKPHIVYRGTDRLIYDIWLDGGVWHVGQICTAQAAADPVATANGTIALVAVRAHDGIIHAAQYDGTIWTCAPTARATTLPQPSAPGDFPGGGGGGIALRPRSRAATEDVPSPTPVLHLEKVKISGLPEIILTLGSGGRYEGFFGTPIHLRPDQTSYAQTDSKEIELTGRIQIEESGTRRNYDPKKDSKEWPLSGGKGSAPVRIVNADGPIISDVPDTKVRPDGTFAFTSNIIVEGFTRNLTLYPKVDLKGGKSIAATVVVELIDLDGFLALVDPKEKARPASQTHLEFLASVRKIYQGGPKDPLRGAFDWVLYRHRDVKPLVALDTAEDKRFKLYGGEKGLFADREWLDIGHVLTGIEGSPKQEPSKDQSIPVPRRPELFVTWAGDLGSALQAYIKDFWNAIDTGAPVDLNAYLSRLASRIDLIGDIDGINIGSAYDSSRSLAENLRAYYGHKSRRRYHEFIANSKDKQGRAELPLVPGKKPPQLSKQARQAIADNTREFLVPLWLSGKLYTGTDPYKRKLMDEIIDVNSPEMDTVVEYFARFLEDGLAREP